MSSLTSFGSAGGEALQGHSKVLAILHRGAKRAILTRVDYFILFIVERGKPGAVRDLKFVASWEFLIFFKLSNFEVLHDHVGHVLHPLLTWGAGSSTNVSRFSMTSLAMWSNFSLPEALVWGRMSQVSPWPHLPCDPTSSYLRCQFEEERVKALCELVGHVILLLPTWDVSLKR